MSYDYLIYAYAFFCTFVLSWFGTRAVRWFALRYKILDQPGHRKMHAEPMPLLGGVAIVGAFYIFALGHIGGLMLLTQFGDDWIEHQLLQFLGEDAQVKVAGLLAGGVLIFLLGVVDDLYALKPWLKLVGQIVAAAVLVMSGIRLELFVLGNFWMSAAVTMLWIVLLTNSLNFLDNMDGLCAGVCIISCLSFFLCVQADDTLVRVLLMMMVGGAGGFLYYNLAPARIFMGDAGAMFCGYLLATIAVLGTFHVESTPSRIAVAAPVLALSVPLFDTLSVVYIRFRSGQNIMLGDKRHFSHRLVDLGMSPRQAVEFIYLVAIVVGLGAAMLPLLDLGGTLIILAQTVGVYSLIVILMNAAR
ncbi:MAG: undecaprenyl/decaprenyl-phosphate alpha-N-acetylglucosaminyl 1-phosphate transferase [Candidatus Hydrogenedens sp.]|nr:undecaprenyl/decaprenyl-phosphate alpha-N-acetylglucosaminyl 1-phosphate transferase [Candidatus Hydrogenedens sp.]